MAEKCSKCGAKSVYVDKHSGIKLCTSHLRQYTECRIRRTIGKYRQLTETDHTILYLCRREDIAKLLTLNRIEKEFPAAKLEAIISTSINDLERICNEYNIKLSRVDISSIPIIHAIKSLHKTSRILHTTKLALPLTITDISNLLLWHTFNQINPVKLLKLINSNEIISPFMETSKDIWEVLSPKSETNAYCVLDPPKWFTEATEALGSAYPGADFNILRSFEKLADGKN